MGGIFPTAAHQIWKEDWEAMQLGKATCVPLSWMVVVDHYIYAKYTDPSIT